MTPADWPQAADIYAAGIATGNATFETKPPSWPHFDTSHRPDLRFVAAEGDDLAGWVAATSISDRCCYARVVEHSVYVHPDRRGQGVGRSLMDTLIQEATAAGIWTIQTGIFPENTASLALHQASGFRVVGRRERIGQLNGKWPDVLFLESRSRLRRVPYSLDMRRAVWRELERQCSTERCCAHRSGSAAKGADPRTGSAAHRSSPRYPCSYTQS
jgi:phosphinothricin acetyltransferase